MALLRDSPYIWVTWLTKLLAGENSCEWAAWFRSQHEGWSWERVTGAFDLVGWQLKHTAGINENREHWEERGYTVFTEHQNRFTLRGKTASLGRQARPDRREGRRRHDNRREDRKAEPFPQRPGHALHVRRAQGPGPVQRRHLQWPGGLPGPRGGHPRRGGRPAVHREPVAADTPGWVPAYRPGRSPAAWSAATATSRRRTVPKGRRTTGSRKGRLRTSEGPV